MHTELVYQQKHENIDILGKSINQNRISKLGKSKISEKNSAFQVYHKISFEYVDFRKFF